MDILWTYQDYVHHLGHPNYRVRLWALDALKRQHCRTYTKEVALLIRETDTMLLDRALRYLVEHKALDAAPLILESFLEGREQGRFAKAMGGLGFAEAADSIIESLHKAKKFQDFKGMTDYLGQIRNEKTHKALLDLLYQSRKQLFLNMVSVNLLKHCRPRDVNKVLNGFFAETVQHSHADRFLTQLLQPIGAGNLYEEFILADEPSLVESPEKVFLNIAEDTPFMQGMEEGLEEVWPLIRDIRDRDAVFLLMFKAQAKVKARFPKNTCPDWHREVYEKDKMALAFLEYFAVRDGCWEAIDDSSFDTDIVLCAALACFASIYEREAWMDALVPQAPVSVLMKALKMADKRFSETIQNRIVETAPTEELIAVLNKDLQTWGDVWAVRLMGRIGHKAFFPHLIRVIKQAHFTDYIYDAGFFALEKLDESAHELIMEAIRNQEVGGVDKVLSLLGSIPSVQAFEAAIQVMESAPDKDRDPEYFANTLENIGDKRGVDILRGFIREGHVLGVGDSLETLAALYNRDIPEMPIIEADREKRRKNREKWLQEEDSDFSPFSLEYENQWKQDHTPEDTVDEDIALEDDKEAVARDAAQIGRNAKCPCGSGKKYKKCCMNK